MNADLLRLCRALRDANRDGDDIAGINLEGEIERLAPSLLAAPGEKVALIQDYEGEGLNAIFITFASGVALFVNLDQPLIIGA